MTRINHVDWAVRDLVDIGDLDYFLACCKASGFTARDAPHRLLGHIKRHRPVKANLGMRLFDRGVMPVALTERGRRCRRAPSGSLMLSGQPGRKSRPSLARSAARHLGNHSPYRPLDLARVPANVRDPPAACAPPLALQRLVHLADRRGEGPDHRRIGHGHLPRRHPVRRCVPAGHHSARSSRLPRQVLMALHHERWEHEINSLALRHTLLQGRVLRSGDLAVLEQGIWVLLALYHQ